MAAHLDDGDGLGGEKFLAQAVCLQRGGRDFQHVIAGESGPHAGRRSGDGGNAGHHDGFKPVGKPGEDIHEAAIEEGIALAEHGHIAACLQMLGNGGSTPVVGFCAGSRSVRMGMSILSSITSSGRKGLAMSRAVLSVQLAVR